MMIKHGASLFTIGLTVGLTISLSVGLGACVAEDAALDGDDLVDGPGDIEDLEVEADEADEADEAIAAGEEGGEGPAEGWIVDVAPGEAVEIAEGIAAFAPEPGEGVVMEVLYEDGMTYLADIETDADGIVRLRLPELGFADDGLTRACASKCNDTAYKHLAHRWKKPKRCAETCFLQ